MTQSALERNPALLTPRSYGQYFALSLGKESPHIFSKFNPLNMVTFYDPLSVCINGIWLFRLSRFCQWGGGGGISARNSRALSLFAPYFGAVWTPIRPVAEANK